MTAVEWLIERIKSKNNSMTWNQGFEKALEMEKQQIIDAYRDGRSDQQSERPSIFYNRNSEQYYKEKFKK